jgi:NADH-quinone oxidoreductase subunit E
MSVRRLANIQPDSFAFSPDSEAKAAFWMNKYPEARKASAVIPLLWLAQKQEGWVSEPAMREIAARCAMPYIRVFEVATFYTMFNLEPVGVHLIQVCGTTPCWLRGADGLKAVCEKRIGKKGRGNLSADGKFSWEEVECLGACSNAPMVQIANRDGDYYYEDLTPQALEAILDDLAAGKLVETGPVTRRHCSEPTQAAVKVLEDASLFDGSRAQAFDLPHRARPQEPLAEERMGRPASGAAGAGEAAAAAPKKVRKTAADGAAATEAESEKPTPRKPAAKTPAAKKPAAKKPAAKKPAARKKDE